MALNFENEDDAYSIDVPKEKRYLNTVSYDYSVHYLFHLMREGKIVLEVPFQRKQIWKSDKASALLESIIMNVPIPPLYFAEEEDGKWLVLDGLQRLSSILDFYNNEFSLTKLEVLVELNNKKYKDLPPKAKGLLDDGLLRVNVIRKDSHKDIKYDIFMRLNRGAVTLNYQELRNCLYRGNLNDAAKELCEENKDFQAILNEKKPNDRYLDAEFVIRYFAISDGLVRNANGEIEVSDYKGKLVQYLNDYMEKNKNITTEQKEAYKTRFNLTVEKIITVFGTSKAFRDLADDENNKIYKPIADFIMPSFERMSIEYIENHKTELYERTLKFLIDNHSLISARTSDKDVMNSRIAKWFEELDDVISI